ncbi:MAG: NosD domain-containing protein, partial [Flavobacteriaceae bacterium]|nr:NosD domain-containing protein [Flavobacteriaceae bacterium]
MQGRHGHLRAPLSFTGGRLLRILIGLWLGLMLGAASGAASALTKPAGDLAPIANPDGNLNAADFLVLQKFILGSLTPSAEQRLIADVAPLGSPDGDLNAGDLVVLMRAIQGLVSLPPVYVGPAAPVLNAASGTTNSNPYTLTGTAEPGRTVRLYHDGVLLTTQTAAADGSFSFDLLLHDGSNPLYAVAMDGNQESPASTLLTLDYVNDIPRQQGGVLTGNVVWTPGTTPTPYIISSTLTVAPGATLTLMPGTVLRFAAGAAFQIEGTVIATGDPTAPITFTSDAGNPAPGNWAGIQVLSGSQNTQLVNIIVEYAINGITADAANLIVRNCTVQAFASGFGNYGVGYINGATGRIENCTIDNQGAVGNNNSRGVYVGSNAQPDVKGNRIRNNRTGILIEQSAPWIFGNTVSNNALGILLLEGARALINGQNIITDNYSAGLQFEGGATDFPQCIVNGNSIFNNPWNVYTVSYDYVGDQDVLVDNNWWGSASPSVIASGIWDFKNLPEMAPVVKVTPF